MRYVLSSVGTSLLTNNAGALSKVLRDSANLNEAELSAEQRQIIDSRIVAADELLRTTDIKTCRDQSAELNGLHALFGDCIATDDLHFLVATDTYQGRATAKLLYDHLTRQGITSVEIIAPSKLSTRSQLDFTTGIRDLIRYCEVTFGTCRTSRVPVLFNLVGSFKSLQGYLNTIGMFYADEILYVFEGSTAELIRIPRLPVTLDLSILRLHRDRCAMLADGEWTLPVSEFNGWPELLWEETAPASGRCWLSTWGLLLWERGQEELLNEELLNLPRIEITQSFRKDWQKHTANRRERIELQRRLARAAVLLDQSHGDTSLLKRDSKLQYDNYSGANSWCGHFRVNNQGWRVSCTSEGGKLCLRRFGQHDYVNDSP